MSPLLEFFWACYKGDTDIVRRMCDDRYAMDQIDPLGRTPLILALQNDQHAVVDLLLPISDPNKTDAQGCTPLMWALLKGNRAATQTLLPHSNVHTTNGESRNAMWWAQISGQTVFFVGLLNADHLSQTNDHGQTLLSQAQEKGDQPLVHLLIEREAVVLRQDALQGTAPNRARARL